MSVTVFNSMSRDNRPIPALRATGLTKWMGRRKILDNVDIELIPGDRIALVGSNGAGKTTLLRCLAGETRPTSGTLCWNHLGKEKRPIPKRRIGMVAHECRLYPDLTARENLMFAARMHQVVGAKEQVHHWLQRLDLDQFSDYPAQRLSRGIRQRLAVARALIHDPALVLLDEAFEGMDRQGVDCLCRLIRESSARNSSIIFTTHDRQLAESLATRIVDLQNGHLLEHSVGTPPSSQSTGVTRIAI